MGSRVTAMLKLMSALLSLHTKPLYKRQVSGLPGDVTDTLLLAPCAEVLGAHGHEFLKPLGSDAAGPPSSNPGVPAGGSAQGGLLKSTQRFALLLCPLLYACMPMSKDFGRSAPYPQPRHFLLHPVNGAHAAWQLTPQAAQELIDLSAQLQFAPAQGR
eukprot:1160178-Pelagomonas_calceolata.AAC.18